jgi:hypothetical protein
MYFEAIWYCDYLIATFCVYCHHMYVKEYEDKRSCEWKTSQGKQCKMNVSTSHPR